MCTRLDVGLVSGWVGFRVLVSGFWFTSLRALGVDSKFVGKRPSAGSFGLKQSTVSRRFTEEVQPALEELEPRDLSGETDVALCLDGKQLRGRLAICIGATTAGQKRRLGFTEASTENAAAVKGLLRRLIDRGMDLSGGLLVVAACTPASRT